MKDVHEIDVGGRSKRRLTRIVVAVAIATTITTGAAGAAAISAPAKATLASDAIPIGESLGTTWTLGGFSGLTPIGSSGKEFWTITDRGPVLDACGSGNKQYPVPGFAPEIVRVGVKDDELKVKQRIALRFQAGPAVGYSLRPTPKNEAAFGPACEPLGTSPLGIDTEGLVVDPRDGSFWVVDEYLPSVLHVTTGGNVVTRVVPAGTASLVTDSGASIVEALPVTVGQSFRPNRGFESVAIAPDGETLYVALQSPMDYRPPTPSPDPRNSLAIRVFRLDISSPDSPAVTGQWVYLLDRSPTANRPLADKVSAMIWLGPDVLAIEERDDPTSDTTNPQNTVTTKLYLADFRRATTIPAGSPWNGPASGTGGRTLEQYFIPGQTGAPADLPVAAPKCLWVDVAARLAEAGFTNGKLEGAAYVPARGANPALLAVLNDNDFAVFAPIPAQLNVLGAPALCAP